MRVWLVVFGLVACGRGKFEPLPDGSSAIDAADARPPCTFGDFAAPVRLAGPVNSIVDDWTPSIGASDLTLVFYSQRASVPGEPDLWIAKRANATAQFAAATVITEASSPAREGSPHLTADELELWFVSDRVGAAMSDIYVATRTSTTSPFGTPSRVPELSSNFDDDTMWISGDGLRVWLSSNRGSSSNLFTATRPDRMSSFSSPALVPELSSLDVESSPALSTDELEIFFSSNRPGGVGKYDVWHATRTSVGTPFTTPTIATVNSTEDDWGLSLSADGRDLYYSYSATLAGGNADIWVATRPCD